MPGISPGSIEIAEVVAACMGQTRYPMTMILSIV